MERWDGIRFFVTRPETSLQLILHASTRWRMPRIHVSQLVQSSLSDENCDAKFDLLVFAAGILRGPFLVIRYAT